MILTNNTTSATFELKIQDGWKPKINLAYELIELMNGNYNFVDRGTLSDSYEAVVFASGTDEYINSIVDFIQTARIGGFDITAGAFNGGEHIFGENIDYTTGINIAIHSIGTVTHKTINTSSIKFTIAVDGIVQLSYLGTGNIPILQCLQPKYDADTTWNYNAEKSYYQNYYITDHVKDSGYFKADFSMSIADMKELREFYRQVRGASFQLTSSLITGIDYIFGSRGDILPLNVRIKNIKEKFNGVNNYIVSIEFLQESSIGA